MVMSVVLGLLVALALSHGLSWFTGGMGVWLVLFALGIGMLWDSDAAAASAKVPPPETRISRPVAALGLCLIGMVWGGFLGMWLGSLGAGAAVLAVAPFAIGGLHARWYQRPVPVGYLAFVACSLLSGLGVVMGLVAVKGMG